MATVTALTAARALEIEDKLIVSAEVIDDELILTRHDDTTFDPIPLGAGGGGTVGAAVWDDGTDTYILVGEAEDFSPLMIFVGPDDPKTATGGRDEDNDIWIQTGTVNDTVKAGDILGYVAYIPGADSTILAAGAATSLTDINSGVLAVTFTAPPSGAVMIDVGCLAGCSGASTSAHWGLREGSSQVGSIQQVSNVTTNGRITATFFITGLTPGVSHTYKWAYYKGGTSGVNMYAGPTYGVAMMRAVAL